MFSIAAIVLSSKGTRSELHRTHVIRDRVSTVMYRHDPSQQYGYTSDRLSVYQRLP